MLAVALTIPCLLLAGYVVARLVVLVVAFAPSLVVNGVSEALARFVGGALRGAFSCGAATAGNAEAV